MKRPQLSLQVFSSRHPSSHRGDLLRCLRRSCLALLGIAAIGFSAQADVVELRDGGVITGKVLNPDQGAIVKIETDDGTVVEIDRKLVKIRKTLDHNLDYAKRVAAQGDSADDHRAIIEHCDSRQLVTLANAHRERLVELDPNDRSAWEHMKYFKDDVTGKYMRREVVNQRRGKIKGDKGLWYTWEEKALLDMDQKVTMQRVAAEKEFTARLKGLQSTAPQKQAESQAYFASLNNPLLISKIAKAFRDPASGDRAFYLGLLKQMPPRSVTPTLIGIAMEDRDINVVNECLDFMVAGDEVVRDMAVNAFAGNLRKPETRDRAAYCMTPFHDKRFICDLINALTSSSMVRPAGPPGAMNAGVANNGGVAFANGAPPPQLRVNQHKDVLAALQSLTQENFGYDKLEWRRWFARTYAYENLDLRRDEN